MGSMNRCTILHYEMNQQGNHDFTPVVNHLKHEKKPVFAIFYMRGCGPCEATRPEWNKLRQRQHQLPQNALLLEIDHELKHQLVDTLGDEFAYIRDISSFPTITLLRHGKQMEPYQGRRLMHDFKKWIHKNTAPYRATQGTKAVSDYSGPSEQALSQYATRRRIRHKKKRSKTRRS